MIELKEVTKKFGKKKALDNVTTKINKGKITGLLGPNGSGKSTMLKLITDLNKPSSGKILIDGEEIGIKSKSRISYLPEIDHFYPWMKISDAKKFVKTFYSDWQEERYQELLQFLELEESMKIDKISKGMRAKAKLLLSFSRKADIVLLDEPLSGIDIFTREKIIETIIKDYRAGEQSIIITTHEIKEVENVMDEALFLKNGKIALQGEIENLKEEKNLSLVDLMREVYGNGKQ
ncbi:ABC transporter ATP-binding protein [Proteinivorax hydrogeniformans]|uniref:ABC transporter ATP-binding protein n=1 Tax=Proteinivorax hydrogeniformans TaxID=1826727 RepID=A0AAU8HUC3_9FIRM